MTPSMLQDTIISFFSDDVSSNPIAATRSMVRFAAAAEKVLGKADEEE